ncbi:MAG: transposase [Spirochaetales bacterium]|nr:transposase [Spirochaetales bacterium]
MGRKEGVPLYDDGFKRDAVDLTVHGKSVRQVASDMGISEASLHNWRKKYLDEEGPQRQHLREENERLRREVIELRQERDILKKSVAIFLKPHRTSMPS